MQLNSRFAAGCALLLVALIGQAAGVEAAGIVGATHGSADVTVPSTTPAGNAWYYGMGMPIQLDATTGGLLAGIRRDGTPYADFEAGTDLIKFNSLNNISASGAVPISRPSNELNPWTGMPSITSKYPVVGGFVPLGGRFADGSLHPYGGTGFGFCQVGFYPADFSQKVVQTEYLMEVQQFTYDGSQFTASSPVRMPYLSVGSTGWKITGVGMTPAIPDGRDLLCPVMCSTGVSGVARFQYGTDGWQPASFAPVTSSDETWSEPSLIRDIDGSLLFTARKDPGAPLALWRSTSGDNAWNQLIDVPYGRAYTPVSLHQAVDGTPFLVSSLTLAATIDRNILDLAPINSDRTGLDPKITVRNAPAEFGPAPNGQGWDVDNSNGNVIRLADGQWHSILCYRVDDLGEHYGLPASSYTGCYVEEVFSSGDPRPTGLTFVPEPASGLLVLLAAASILGFPALKRRRVVVFLGMLAWSSIAAIMGQATSVVAAQPGIVGVTHGKVDVAMPPSAPVEQKPNWYYGIGMPIQLDATTGGLMVGIRQNGTPYCDFEVGSDVIVFDNLDNISAKRAVPVSRPVKEVNPWSGTPSLTSNYPMGGGFVPLGARLADGSLHPHGGTGFGIYEVGFYPADPTQPLPSRIGYHFGMHQLRYDGHRFTASPQVRLRYLGIAGTDWKIGGVGMSPAIPDDCDLLCPVTASNDKSKGATGIARFQYGSNGWRPTSFVAVTSLDETWSEPSLIRDIDKSLLFTARDNAGTIALWRSANGKDWKQLIRVVRGRGYAPVSVNQAVDGTPYLVTTLAASNDRNFLDIVPINASRTGLGKPIPLRNGLVEFGSGPVIERKEANQFGPGPNGKGWHVDHGIGNVVRLADGRWHSIISYRVDAKAEHFGQPGTPFTGYYVEEVSSSGEPHPMGFDFGAMPAAEASKPMRGHCQ